MLALLVMAMGMKVCRVASWAKLPALRVAELAVLASSFSAVLTMAVQTLVFNPDGNAGLCDASLDTMLVVAAAKLSFYFFLLQRV
ncbi:hypothetical protein RQP46_003194 [Phenoliferia psychrophenolica]